MTTEQVCSAVGVGWVYLLVMTTEWVCSSVGWTGWMPPDVMALNWMMTTERVCLAVEVSEWMALDWVPSAMG